VELSIAFENGALENILSVFVESLFNVYICTLSTFTCSHLKMLVAILDFSETFALYNRKKSNMK